MNKQVKESEIAYFNTYGEDVDFDAINDKGYYRIINELLKNLSKPYFNLKVIDLGCATGCFTIKLAKLGLNNIKGIDISPNCIDYAQKKDNNIDFEVGDIENLKFVDEEFDVVLLFGVVHHFPDLTDSIKEAYRILKKGGILFTYDPHMNNPFIWIYRNKTSPFYSSVNITENERPLTKQEIKKALNSFNFTESKVYCISGVTLNTQNAKFEKIVKTFMKLYNFVEKLIDFYPFDNILGSSIISVSKK